MNTEMVETVKTDLQGLEELKKVYVLAVDERLALMSKVMDKENPEELAFYEEVEDKSKELIVSIEDVLATVKDSLEGAEDVDLGLIQNTISIQKEGIKQLLEAYQEEKEYVTEQLEMMNK